MSSISSLDSSTFQTCSRVYIYVRRYHKNELCYHLLMMIVDSLIELESDRMVGNNACAVSTDGGGINDSISSVPVCRTVDDIVHKYVSKQYSAATFMSGVTKSFGQ